MSEKKFEISGEIEGTDGENKKRIINGRFVLLLFVIIVVGAVFYFPFLQQQYPALRKYTLNTTADYADSLEQQKTTSKHTIDSLIHLTDSLEQINTLLVQPGSADTGLYFEVQIGAFKNFDLKKYRGHLVGLQGVEQDGYGKLTLGRFRDVKIAREFLADIREVGFKDAWVVAKRNGKRVPFDTALLGEEMP